MRGQATQATVEKLGRYELCFELAQGGMATVYLARAVGPGGYEKLVALKRIHERIAADPKFVDMFFDEARLASRISHPNVCSIIDFGEAQGTYYIAMEYLVGEPLSRIMRVVSEDPAMRRVPRHAAFSAKVIADACEGLHAAHELHDSRGEPMNVVHRDVSPQNLFVTYGGHVSVVDFGIASAAERLHQSVAGEVKGKLSYMAPEQLRGTSFDRRADVWALGVVLWELLTTESLFRKKQPADTIQALLHNKIFPPSVVSSSAPPELDEIVMNALQRDPDLRYPTARAFGRDLLRFLGKQEEPVGLPDLADWMEKLFPAGHQRKRQLIDIATQSIVVPRVEEGSPTSNVTYVDPKTFVPHDTVSEEVSTADMPPPGRARRWVWVSAALLIGGGVVASWLLLQPAPPTERTVRGLVTESEVPVVAQPADPSVAVRPSDTTPPAVVPSVPPDVIEPAPPVVNARRGDSQPRVAPPPRVAVTGTVNIATPGWWAAVFHRGRALGHTPLQVQLPEGRQAIELRSAATGVTKRMTVRVRGGQIERLVVPAQ